MLSIPNDIWQVLYVDFSEECPETPSTVAKSASVTMCDTTDATHHAHRHPTPPPVEEILARATFVCCQQLQCKSRFASPDHPWDACVPTLAEEQRRFLLLTRPADRKVEVTHHMPLYKSRLGSMLAAGQIVCNLFFKTVFGVSTKLINACKQTSGVLTSCTISM